MWYVLGVLLVLALAQAYFMAGGAIPYSEFKQLLRRGALDEVVVGDETISGALKPGLKTSLEQTKFSTTRIDDPKLVEDLDAQHVKYKGEIVSRWLPQI